MTWIFNNVLLQIPHIWDDELHNVVQMGFGSGNAAPSGQDIDGIALQSFLLLKTDYFFHLDEMFLQNTTKTCPSVQRLFPQITWRLNCDQTQLAVQLYYIHTYCITIKRWLIFCQKIFLSSLCVGSSLCLFPTSAVSETMADRIDREIRKEDERLVAKRGLSSACFRIVMKHVVVSTPARLLL